MFASSTSQYLLESTYINEMHCIYKWNLYVVVSQYSRFLLSHLNDLTATFDLTQIFPRSRIENYHDTAIEMHKNMKFDRSSLTKRPYFCTSRQRKKINSINNFVYRSNSELNLLCTCANFDMLLL